MNAHCKTVDMLRREEGHTWLGAAMVLELKNQKRRGAREEVEAWC